MMRIAVYINILFILSGISNSEIRFVSKTGSNIPPYLSWETAARTIQQCIDVAHNNDTIIVANGTYKEALLIDSALTLLGSSMDSCIIDGTGLEDNKGITIKPNNYLNIQNFYIKGKNIEPLTGVIGAWYYTLIAKNLKIENAHSGIGVLNGYPQASIIENCIIRNVNNCIDTGSPYNLDTFKISNNLLVNNQSPGKGIGNIGGGIHYIYHNILMGENPSLYYGIDLSLDKYSEVKNNLIANYTFRNYDGSQFIDSAIIENNVFIQSGNAFNSYNILILKEGPGTLIRNNIIAYAKSYGIWSENDTAFADYNLFWGNKSAANNLVRLGENNVFADPMFMRDTIAAEKSDFNYHLQAYSPAIDAGDPLIKDKDGSRSDIGMYGGILGEIYSYMDLAPGFPKNIAYTIQSDSQKVVFDWQMNTEADFGNYNIYRDTTAGFMPADQNRIMETKGPHFEDYYSSFPLNIYYKITAADSQDNESVPAKEIQIITTSVKNSKVQAADQNMLYQNYPNPFNSETKISYCLEDQSYVKLMVYDIKGELMEVIVNKVQERGFHEVKFNSGILSSGIYFYRIEIIGKDNFPKHTDMKKLIILK